GRLPRQTVDEGHRARGVVGELVAVVHDRHPRQGYGHGVLDVLLARHLDVGDGLGLRARREMIPLPEFMVGTAVPGASGKLGPARLEPLMSGASSTLACLCHGCLHAGPAGMETLRGATPLVAC